MARKSYLSRQIRLISLNATDLMTNQEYDIYSNILSCMSEQSKLETEAKKNNKKIFRDDMSEIIEKKKRCQDELNQLILKHANTPRVVRMASVMDRKKYKDLPVAVTWWGLKNTKRIAEFESEESRQLGLHHLDITFDKIILKWKSPDLLKQIVLNGFYMPILTRDGSVCIKKYHVMTASAGQLRTDKVQCISDEGWEKIRAPSECGLTWDVINQKGGVNVNKLLAYTSLSTSATDVFDFPIDKCIVVPDFEAPVTGMMQYIDPDYKSSRSIRTIVINHIDGCGVMLPKVSIKNFMVRGPWLKGLLSPFDFLWFCQVHNVKPVIKDVWGLEHDLIAEDIQIMFTASQLKMWKFYDSWNQYKSFFKQCHCHLCATNYEESYIPDAVLNYQFIQTLVDMTNDEIKQFTNKTFHRIRSIAIDKEAMLRTLKADEEAENPHLRALNIYPELLREYYARDTLKNIKKRMTLDAASGKIRCQNKRLFVIPDLYAACERWFLGIEEPKGLLANGEVGCKIYRDREKLDLLRSPSLYMEHAVRKVSKDPKVYEWLLSDGVYTSCHDLVSRILQFDCDGDQIHAVADPLIIDIAERNIKSNDIIPLYYDSYKADPEQLSRETMYNGLKRAHDYSGIGAISNDLTKLWNKPDPDYEVAAWLAYYNNQVIDAAKTGKINSFSSHEDIERRVSKATGGKRGRMPYFFGYSINGRREMHKRTIDRKTFAKPTKSTMNRIAAVFEKVGNINMNYAGIAPFNWQMLLESEKYIPCDRAVQAFCNLDNTMISDLARAEWEGVGLGEKIEKANYDLIAENIIHEIEAIGYSLETVYPSVVRLLFTGENEQKSFHKQMFWRVFGDIACRNLAKNVANCTVCEKCGMKVPNWAIKHQCIKDKQGFFNCIDCGIVCERTNSKQCRCATCQQEYRKKYIRKYNSNKK